MGKVKQNADDLAELALMGKFVSVDTEDNVDLVRYITDYIRNVFSIGEKIVEKPDKDDGSGDDIYIDHVHRYNGRNKVTHIGCNTVEGMRCITLCIDTQDNELPKPFEEDYGSGYPCSFCYVFNYDAPEFSEFGNCFFEKQEDNYYHRVS